MTVLDRVRASMQSALQLTDDERVAVGAGATPVTVRGWTSLAHVQLILELEKQFDVLFDADEIASLASVDAILAALAKRNVS
jgi:acyl carrier protein